MDEEIVVILDANRSMGEAFFADPSCAETNDNDNGIVGGVGTDEMAPSAVAVGQETDRGNARSKWNTNHEDRRVIADDFLGTTKFDVARCIAREVLLEPPSPPKGGGQTRALALITLGGRNQRDQNHYNWENRKRKRSWISSGRSKDTGDHLADVESCGGCACYGCHSDDDDHRSSNDWMSKKILGNLGVSSPSSRATSGDFATGMVRATEALVEKTTVGAGHRRVVLITDARHKVLAEPEDSTQTDPLDRLADAMTKLRAMACHLEVVGIGFRREKLSGRDRNPRTTECPEQDRHAATESDDDSDGESSCCSTNGNDDDEHSEESDDWSDVQDQNELLLIDLVEKLGGCVVAVNGGAADDLYGMNRVFTQLNRASDPRDSSEGRDVSSLRPLPDTRLYWNGRDDVLLPEWVGVARPSFWSGCGNGDPSESCLWIQIDDPLRPQHQRGDLLLPKNLSCYRNAFEKFQEIIGESANALDPNDYSVEKAVERFEANGPAAVHWLVHCSVGDVDAIWEKIAIATAYGKLGPTSLVFPTKHLLQPCIGQSSGRINENQTAVICVCGKDSTERADTKRVFCVLFGDLGINSGLVPFQSGVSGDSDHQSCRSKAITPSTLVQHQKTGVVVKR